MRLWLLLALYNLFLPLFVGALRFASIFNVKLKRGFAGRQQQRDEIRHYYISAKISGIRVIVHVASYGELEQAKPVISELRLHYPNVHIHLTFFSPSGYENVIGKYRDADYISYLPLDYRNEVSAFLDVAKPDLVLFTRYDVWPNLASELARRRIPSILFAATASEESRRLMPIIRSFHAAVYRKLSCLLVISSEDRDRFLSMGVHADRIAVAGDTRFDQVLARKVSVEQADFTILASVRDHIETKNTLVFVIGSSWPEDELVVKKTLTQSIERGDNILTIIAPHEPSEQRVRELLAEYRGKAIRFSELDRYNDESVILVDSIGKLFGLYRSADIAMIGGGFSDGVHNVLEAAVWGVPVIVGPNHKKSQEIGKMIEHAAADDRSSAAGLAAFEVSSAKEFDFTFWQLALDENLRESTGENASSFVQENRGATPRIVEAIRKQLEIRTIQRESGRN